MCVVLLCDNNVRPDREMVAKAWRANTHGGGAAWRDGKGNVRWAKGLDEEEMAKLAETLDFPFVLHFRIASTGGQEQLLCHPFEISKTAVPRLEGVSKNPVLFHNGTYTTWRTDAKELALRSGVKLPSGLWNDTRTMAWMTSVLGMGILEFINEKTVVFGPDTIDIFGSGWSDEKGILVSNKLFLNVSNFRSGNGTAAYYGYVPTGGGKSSGNVAGSHSSTNGSLVDGNDPKEIVVTKAERTGGSSSLLDLPFRGSVGAFQVGSAQSIQIQPNQEPPAQEEKQEGKEEVSEEDRLNLWWAKTRNPKPYHGATPKPEPTNLGISFLGMR